MRALLLPVNDRFGLRKAIDYHSPMSELSTEQLEHFRRKLVEAKESAEALLGATADDEKPLERSGSTMGILSRMDALQVHAMSQMSRRQLEVRLKQIDASLQAMERGKYGLCRNCGEQVGLARLEALPEAPFCVDCQESFE
jgi:DnaK suppressor protein